jgi:hypothetical protein
MMPRPRKRVLELSCGVGSLQQVPSGTPTGERATLRASRARMARIMDYASAGVPLPFLLCSLASRQKVFRSLPRKPDSTLGPNCGEGRKSKDGQSSDAKKASRERGDLSVDRDADVAEYDPRYWQ